MPLQQYALYKKQRYKVVGIGGGRNGIPSTALLEAPNGERLTVLEKEIGKFTYEDIPWPICICGRERIFNECFYCNKG